MKNWKELWKERTDWRHITDSSTTEYGFMHYGGYFLFKVGDRWASVAGGPHISMILSKEPMNVLKELFSEFKLYPTPNSEFALTKAGFIVEILNEVPEDISMDKEFDSVGYYTMLFHDMHDCRLSKVVADKSKNLFESKGHGPFEEEWVFDYAWHGSSCLFLPFSLNTSIYSLRGLVQRVDSSMVMIGESFDKGYFISDDGEHGYVFSRCKRKDPGFRIKSFFMEDVLQVTQEDFKWMGMVDGVSRIRKIA